jgi:hypothetical protein
MTAVQSVKKFLLCRRNYYWTVARLRLFYAFSCLSSGLGGSNEHAAQPAGATGFG